MFSPALHSLGGRKEEFTVTPPPFSPSLPYPIPLILSAMHFLHPLSAVKSWRLFSTTTICSYTPQLWLLVSLGGGGLSMATFTARGKGRQKGAPCPKKTPFSAQGLARARPRAKNRLGCCPKAADVNADRNQQEEATWCFPDVPILDF
ncbi:hypothetical protein Pyn_07189 [Prunus yedoensis var. nudiflora]|uniref:Uncharacterized protein n=1 Tax=Prunus yedoensis var. nudiflora TaxID=2094558 RepID=A0A314Z9G5_PRUYE|nr:hypothetical protein Pyn_07189 [Prunus yedoensis var. nudiflora]